MTAFEFGRTLRTKLAAGPGLPQPTASLTGKSTLPSTPAPQQPSSAPGRQQVSPQAFAQLRARQGQLPTPKSHTGLGSYADVVDRWYNPWTTQKVTEKGEHGLMRAGQIAMGTGAAAATAAGAIAAAPTVAGAVGMGGAGSGTTAATAGGGAVAATQTPAGQNMLQRGSQMAGQAMQTVNQQVVPRLNSAYDTMQRFGYSPDGAASDAYAVATGNFDKVKGPSWTGGMKVMGGPNLNLPSGSGAPFFPMPKPVDLAKQMYGGAQNTGNALAGVFR